MIKDPFLLVITKINISRDYIDFFFLKQVTKNTHKGYFFHKGQWGGMLVAAEN